MADWKEKYFSSLEKLEDKEKEWHEAEQLFRRCLSRITLSADGQGKKLDSLLERLRNSVRHEKSLSRIQNTVDAIIETSSDIAENKIEKLEIKQVLLEIIKNISFPHKYNNDIKRITKKIENSKEGNEPIENLASLLSEIIAEVDHTEIEKKGMFSGLFSKTSEAVEETNVEEKEIDVISEQNSDPSKNTEVQAQETNKSASDVDEALVLVRDVLTDYLGQLEVPKNDVKKLKNIRQRVESLNARGELKKLVSDLSKIIVPDSQGSDDEEHTFEVNEILIQLLERMDLPVELNERVDVLKLKWKEGVEEDEIVDALEDIAELIIEIRTRIEREKNEIQLFLQQVTDRLLELDQHIQEDVEFSENIFNENKSFGNEVEVQVKNIRSNVQDATDLAKLKLSIYEKLEIINSHVEGFRGKEEQRKIEMKNRVEELTEKVNQLEGESGELKERIVEERQQSMLDALTQIPNRLAWNERIELEHGRWQRYKAPLVIAIWDVDDFKNINDTYGHKAGDKVLTTIANMLNDQIRETDFLARFGGEEFVVLFTETNVDDAVAVMEKLRAGVAECQFHHGEKEVKITVSGGFTEFKEGDTVETAFERADQFMYKAKHKGKNCCMSDNDK